MRMPLLALAMAAGLYTAAFRAWTWPEQVRKRTLIVIAEPGTKVEIAQGPQTHSTTQGVHTWTVAPGPLTLVVNIDSDPPRSVPLNIPVGIGGLMVEISLNDDGDVQLGYF
jgi:hypothetical protein